MENRIIFEIRTDIPIPRYPVRGLPRGDCHCGGFPRPGFKSCDKCLDSTKRQRQARIEQGLCEYFGCPDPPKPGHTSCDLHLKKMLAYSLAQRARRQQAKLCIDCGKHPQWWTQRCVMCRGDYSTGLPQGARAALRRYRRLESIDARRQRAEQAVGLIEDERKRAIIVLRHGLHDGIDHTLEEIGQELNITRERVRQLESKALARLQLAGFDVGLLRPPFTELQRPQSRDRVHLSEHQRKKERAHSLVTEALKDGRLVRQPCQECGRVDSIAHHPDYDKPLEVQWVCRPHHAQAHGRGKGSKRVDKVPPPKGPRDGWWLKKVEPSNEHYDAAAIVAVLRRHNIKQKALWEATGLHTPVLNLIVRGRQVRDHQLLAVLRFTNELEQRP